jgi:hypothetical protein
MIQHHLNIRQQLNDRLTALEHDVERLRRSMDERMTEEHSNEIHEEGLETLQRDIWAKVNPVGDGSCSARNAVSLELKTTYLPKDRATRTWFFDQVDDEDEDAIHRMERAGILFPDYKKLTEKQPIMNGIFIHHGNSDRNHSND